jgi:hypothetical protein
MRRFNIIMFFSLISAAASAQFVNLGATVTIQPGATLRVETDFINTSGTVNNNGTLEVMGNLTNAATFNSPSGSKVRFIGGSASQVTSGGAVLRDVDMAKTANNIVLQDAMSIAGELNFVNDNNKVILGNYNLTLTSSGSIASADANEYVATTGTGSLIKPVAGNGTITHEIGDAANYTPLSSAVTGTGYASATLGARVIDATHPNKPVEADSYLSRYWAVAASGITDYNNAMTGTYASSGDANGTSTRIKGATYVSPNWSFTGAATNGSSTVTGSTSSNSVDFTGMNALNKVDITAYLASPLSGGSMTNILQVYDPPATPTLLPTTSPYGAPTATYADIANPTGVAGMITDWVKVEVRDATNPATILETKSLLLKTNGHIVDPTGSIPYFKDHNANVRYAIHHRNHLAVLSNGTAGTFEGQNLTYDFSSAQSQAAKLDSGDPNQLQLKNGLFCMIPGDVNSDLEVNGSDLTSVRINFNLGSFDVYISQDLNLDGGVDGIDLTTTRISFNTGFYSTLANL